MKKKNKIPILIAADFHCMRCYHEFNSRPGPWVICIKCGYNYVKWLDFERWL